MTSAVSVSNPTPTNLQHGQQTSGAISGAAQGAAAGAAVGSIVPVIGTAVGAVVGGIIGGIGGLLGGGKLDKSKREKKIAEKWATQGKEREAALQRNQMLREFRLKRAEAAVMITADGGGTQSSAVGALSSAGSQYAFSDAYFGGQTMIQNQVAKHLRKAGKYQASANTIFGAMDAVSGAANAFSGMGLSFGPKPSGVTGSSGLEIPNIPFNPILSTKAGS